MKELSVQECISSGWKIFTSRASFFVGSSLLILLASLIANIPSKLGGSRPYATTEMMWIGIVGSLVTFFLSFFISMGIRAFYLKAHDHVHSIKISALWHPHPYWKFAITSLVMGVAIIIGLLLFIVPGIILGITFGFSLYIVIEKGSSPIDALKESARITKGNRWNLFLLGLAILGINILGLFALIVGLLVTVPISALAMVHAYRVLSGNKHPHAHIEREAGALA